METDEPDEENSVSVAIPKERRVRSVTVMSALVPNDSPRLVSVIGVTIWTRKEAILASVNEVVSGSDVVSPASGDRVESRSMISA